MPELFQETRFLEKAFVFLFGSQVSMQHFDGNHWAFRENQVLPLIHTTISTARQCLDNPITAYLFADDVIFVSHIPSPRTRIVPFSLSIDAVCIEWAGLQL